MYFQQHSNFIKMDENSTRQLFKKDYRDWFCSVFFLKLHKASYFKHTGCCDKIAQLIIWKGFRDLAVFGGAYVVFVVSYIVSCWCGGDDDRWLMSCKGLLVFTQHCYLYNWWMMMLRSSSSTILTSSLARAARAVRRFDQSGARIQHG